MWVAPFGHSIGGWHLSGTRLLDALAATVGLLQHYVCGENAVKTRKSLVASLLSFAGALRDVEWWMGRVM